MEVISESTFQKKMRCGFFELKIMASEFQKKLLLLFSIVFDEETAIELGDNGVLAAMD